MSHPVSLCRQHRRDVHAAAAGGARGDDRRAGQVPGPAALRRQAPDPPLHHHGTASARACSVVNFARVPSVCVQPLLCPQRCACAVHRGNSVQYPVHSLTCSRFPRPAPGRDVVGGPPRGRRRHRRSLLQRLEALPRACSVRSPPRSLFLALFIRVLRWCVAGAPVGDAHRDQVKQRVSIASGLVSAASSSLPPLSPSACRGSDDAKSGLPG